jgi:hypothetical protein
MKFTILCGLLSFALVGVQFCSPVLAASADPHLKEAEQAFSQKRFHAAEDLLNAELAKNPMDQEAHLLLARTYVQLLDNKAAEHEYANCIKCNPFSSIGRMAHQETINIGGRSAADKARPSDDVGTVSRSVDAINREANDLKSGYGTASNTMTPTYSNPQNGLYNPYGQAGMSGAYGQPGMPGGAYGQAGMSGAYGQPGMPGGAYGQAGMSGAYGQPGMPGGAYGQAGMSGAYGQPGMPGGAYGQAGMSGAYGQPGVSSVPGQTGLSAYGQPSARQTAAQSSLAAQRAQLVSLRATRLSTLNQPPAAPYSISPNSALNSALGSSGMAPPMPSSMTAAMPPSMIPSMPAPSVGMPNFTQTYTPSMNLRTSRGRAFSAAQAGASTTPTGTWSYTTSDAQVQQMHKQQEDAQHAQYAQDSANNLQRLMSEKQNSNQPKLRALGTNLFVRYYGSHDQDGSTASAPAADPVVEMKANQWKLGDMK